MTAQPSPFTNFVKATLIHLEQRAVKQEGLSFLHEPETVFRF
jgi:hypothetical protein